MVCIAKGEHTHKYVRLGIWRFWSGWKNGFKMCLLPLLAACLCVCSSHYFLSRSFYPSTSIRVDSARLFSVCSLLSLRFFFFGLDKVPSYQYIPVVCITLGHMHIIVYISQNQTLVSEHVPRKTCFLGSTAVGLWWLRQQQLFKHTTILNKIYSVININK